MNQSFWGIQSLIILVVIGVLAFFNNRAADSDEEWHASLNKPRWTPPGNVARWIWISLYFFLLLSANFAFIQTYGSFRVWLMILLLNNAVLQIFWTILFFKRKQVRAAAIEISVLWIATLAAIVLASKHTAVGASLLIPSFLWISFETSINWWIVRNAGKPQVTD